MITFTLSIMIVFVLTMISLSLRLFASGISITKTVFTYNKTPSEQSSGGSHASDLIAASLKRLSKWLNKLRNIILIFSVGSGIILAMVMSIFIIASAYYITSFPLSGDYYSLSDTSSNSKTNSTAMSKDGYYWRNLELCETESPTKTYMDDNKITSRTSDQWKLWHENAFGEVKEDDIGLQYIEDKDPVSGETVKYYTVAVGKAYTSEIGDKLRITMDSGFTWYAILGDQKADKDTHAGNKSEYLKENIPEDEWDGRDFDRCLAGSEDMLELIIDSEKFLKSSDVPDEYKHGSMNHDYHDEAKFSGVVTKMEKLEYKAGSEADTQESNGDGPKTATQLNVTGRVIWIGDSRTVQLQNAVASGQVSAASGKEDLWSCKGSQGYDYFVSTSIPYVNENAKKGDTIVMNYGLNSLDSIDAFISKMNELATGDWKDYNIVYMSLPSVVDERAKYVSNEDNQASKVATGVKTFNKKLKSKLDPSITYLDVTTYLDSTDYFWDEQDTEGIHYSGGYKTFNYIYQAVRGGN